MCDPLFLKTHFWCSGHVCGIARKNKKKEGEQCRCQAYQNAYTTTQNYSSANYYILSSKNRHCVLLLLLPLSLLLFFVETLEEHNRAHSHLQHRVARPRVGLDPGRPHVGQDGLRPRPVSASLAAGQHRGVRLNVGLQAGGSHPLQDLGDLVELPRTPHQGKHAGGAVARVAGGRDGGGVDSERARYVPKKKSFAGVFTRAAVIYASLVEPADEETDLPSQTLYFFSVDRDCYNQHLQARVERHYRTARLEHMRNLDTRAENKRTKGIHTCTHALHPCIEIHTYLHYKHTYV